MTNTIYSRLGRYRYGVDADALSHLNKQRNHNLSAGFDDGGFSSTRSRVTLYPVRFGRFLEPQSLAVPLPALVRPANHIDLHAVFEVLDIAICLEFNRLSS